MDRFHVLAVDLRGHGAVKRRHTTACRTSCRSAHISGLRLQSRMLIGTRWAAKLVAQYTGYFPDVPSRVVLIEGLGPPPPEMDEEVRGGQRLSRASTGVRRTRGSQISMRRTAGCGAEPAAAGGQGSDLALLGTRAREDGALEWKFDPMLATISVTGPYHLEYAMGSGAASPRDADRARRRIGGFWRSKPARCTSSGRPAAAFACFQRGRFVEIAGAGHMCTSTGAGTAEAIREFRSGPLERTQRPGRWTRGTMGIDAHARCWPSGARMDGAWMRCSRPPGPRTVRPRPGDRGALRVRCRARERLGGTLGASGHPASPHFAVSKGVGRGAPDCLSRRLERDRAGGRRRTD